MIKEFTCSMFGVVSIFVFIFPAELQSLHLISSTSFTKCSKIRAEPCKVLYVHWKRAGPVLSWVFEHGNASDCSISSGGGELPPTTVVQEPWTSQMVIKLSKAGLPGLQEVLGTPHGRTVTPHPISMAWVAKSMARVLWESVPDGFVQPITRCTLTFAVSLCLEREQYSWLFFLLSQPCIRTRFLPWLVWWQRK